MSFEDDSDSQYGKQIPAYDDAVRYMKAWTTGKLALLPDKEDYEAMYWAEQSIRRQVSRNIAAEMEEIRADAAWWRETASLSQPNGGDA